MISWSKVSRYVGKCNVIRTISAFDKNWPYFFNDNMGQPVLSLIQIFLKWCKIEKKMNRAFCGNLRKILESIVSG